MFEGFRIKPELRFGVSHRKCRVEGLCDEADCKAVHDVIQAFKEKYKKKAVIDYIDWEFRPLPDQDEEKLKKWGRQSDGIVFIIEKEIGKSQLDGYQDCIERAENGLPSPRTFIYLKRDLNDSQEEFMTIQEAVHKEIKRKVNIFTDPDSLARQFENDLCDDKWIEKRIKAKGLPGWIRIIVYAIVLVCLAAFGLLFFGNRDRQDSTVLAIPFGDTTSVIVPIDSAHSPDLEKEPKIDESRSKSGHAGIIGSHEGKRAGGSSSHENPDMVFEENAFAVLSEDNDPDIVFEIERQLKAAQLGLSFSNGGVPQWRIVIRESITDTMRIEYDGNVIYDPTVKIYASIFNTAVAKTRAAQIT